MAHQPGWIELYTILEAGSQPEAALVSRCKNSRTSLGETMLHWYAIEGAPDVLQRLINLGFAVNVQRDFGHTPVMDCSLIGRWDNARVLLKNGADLSILDDEGLDYFQVMDEFGVEIPNWVRSAD